MKLTEQEGALAMQQIVRSVCYMHSIKIAHRDIKAENVLISGGDLMEQNGLKVGDFGLSARFRNGQVWNARVGTPSHWAPEVVVRKYSQGCDVWACGVLMYNILSGELPFSDANDCEDIREGRLTFSSDNWQTLSPGSVDCVSQLLTDDVEERPSARKALRHPWFRTWVPPIEESRIKLEHLVRMRSFRSTHRLKRAALVVISTMLEDKELSAAHKLFTALDMNGDGFLTLEELRARLKNSRAIEEIELETIFKDGMAEGKPKPFSYTEFVAAMCFLKGRVLNDSICRAAFRNFDKNGDGQLTLETLAIIGLTADIPAEELQKLLQDVDLDQNEIIDFQEFCTMLRGGRPKTRGLGGKDKRPGAGRSASAERMNRRR